jgi:hypothetical protein
MTVINSHLLFVGKGWKNEMSIDKDKKVQVTSVIPIEHKELLARIAAEEGRPSLSAQIAYVIKLYLDKNKKNSLLG